MNDILHHIYGLFIRQIYLLKRSPPRLLSYVFWPTLTMLIWGFFNTYLIQQLGTIHFALSVLLGAALLATIFERANLNFMTSFLEDINSRNLINVMIAPIKTWELVIGILLNALTSTFVGVSVAYAACYFVFDYTVFSLGPAAALFMLNLVTASWWVGMFLICIILRFGRGAEPFSWMLGIALSPLVAIYYPVTILPGAIQHLSWLLPPTYVFEGLRHFIKTGEFNHVLFFKGLALNVVYFVIALLVFNRQMTQARKRGGILSLSE